MQSAYKQEHEEYRRALRRFLDAELEPNIERFVADGGHDTSFWLKADEAGMLGVTIPEEYGTDEMQKIAIARSLWGGARRAVRRTLMGSQANVVLSPRYPANSTSWCAAAPRSGATPSIPVV